MRQKVGVLFCVHVHVLHMAHHVCVTIQRYRLKQRNGPVKLLGAYGERIAGYKVFNHEDKFTFKHGGVLPSLKVAYETWGELNSDRSNAILVHTGLSASAHARSNQVCISHTHACAHTHTHTHTHTHRTILVQVGGRSLLGQDVHWTQINSSSSAQTI